MGRQFLTELNERSLLSSPQFPRLPMTYADEIL